MKEQDVSWFQNWEDPNKGIKVGKISDKDDILTVEEKRIALIVNKTKIIINMPPRQRELEARWLKESNMRI